MQQAVAAVPMDEPTALGNRAAARRTRATAELETLYTEHYAAVLGVVTARLRCPETAADVAQETFARALAAADGSVRMINPRAWLLRTAHNLCVDHWRHQQRSAPLPDDLVAEDRCEPDSAVLRAADERRVRQALAGLPARDRTALILRDVQARPVSQVAEALGVTIGSASVLLHRARGRARRAYEGARTLLAPPGLVDVVRRWHSRVSTTVQSLPESATAACASACTAALVLAITATVIQSGAASATVAGTTQSPPPAAAAVAEHTRTARATRQSRPAPPALITTTTGHSRQRAGGRQAPRARDVEVPGTTVYVSSEKPEEPPTIAVKIRTDLAGERVGGEAAVYDDVGVVDAVDGAADTVQP